MNSLPPLGPGLDLLVHVAVRLLKDNGDLDATVQRAARLIRACHRHVPLLSLPDHLHGSDLLGYITNQARPHRARAAMRTHLRALVRGEGVTDPVVVKAEVERQLEDLLDPGAPATPAANALTMREEFLEIAAHRTTRRNVRATKRLVPKKPKAVAALRGT